MHKLFNNVQIDYSIFIKVKSYAKNEIIFNEGTSCDSIGLVIKGNVSINTYTYVGNEYNIISLSKDDIFGSTLIFTDNPIYLGDIISITESKIILITKRNLIYLMQNDLAFLNNYLTLITNVHLANQRRIKVLIQKSIRDKILFYLYEEAKATKSNKVIIKSKVALATFLNIPRPSLSRELMKMKKEYLIDYGRNYITLNDSCLL